MSLYFTAPLPNPPMYIRFPVEYITDVSFIVQWDAVTNQSDDRYIVKWTDGTNPIQIVTVNETSYNVTGLTPNTTYTVIVAAVNNCGTGTFSTNESVTTNISFSIDIASTATVFFSIKPTAITITTITSTTTTTATTITNSVTDLMSVISTTNTLCITSELLLELECMIITPSHEPCIIYS